MVECLHEALGLIPSTEKKIIESLLPYILSGKCISDPCSAYFFRVRRKLVSFLKFLFLNSPAETGQTAVIDFFPYF